MAHRTWLLLSLASVSTLLLALTPGCGGSSAPTAQVAINWSVEVGSNNTTLCPVGGGDTWSIGNPEGNPIVTAPAGGSFNGVPVTASCQVAQNGSTYRVNANAQYGNQGSLTITATITPGSGGAANWPAQTGVQATFSDGTIKEALSESDCTISFAANPNMGIAPSKIWGTLTCPTATATDGKTCQGQAEFLFESCLQ
jgi:hypothetical protein